MPIPYVFLTDDAFSLTRSNMKRDAKVQEKRSKRRLCNYRFSSGRRIAENGFVIMSNAFRFLRRQLMMQPEKSRINKSCSSLYSEIHKKIFEISRYPTWHFRRWVSWHRTVGQSASKLGQNCFPSVVTILLNEVIATGYKASELTFI